MARSTKAPKKRAAVSKKKTNTTSGVERFLRSNRSLVFIIAFALVGVVTLLQINAQPALPANGDDIVAAFVREKPAHFERDESGKVTFPSYPSTYVVLADGTIRCDEGSLDGEITIGKLATGQVKSLQREILKLDLADVPSETLVGGTDAQVNNHEGFLIADGDKTYGFAVYEGATKPSKLAKMQDRITKECTKADKKSQRFSEKEIKLPTRLSAAAAPEVRNIFASALFPKVSAVPESPTAKWMADIENHQVTRINQHRAAHGIYALNRKGCLDNVARPWSKYMSETGYFAHNRSYAPQIDQQCAPARYRTAGENVGWNYGSTTTGSEAMMKQFMASPGHRANILSRTFRDVGVGAYYNPTNNRFYVTQNFALF